ncbi:clavaminate synthase family protein [Ascoidea rubescens DSM 1968]|uniref:Clavaminate synthase-like protein n=1 Tax=Ascoidea rubescens DSM 1968 TaxID=1344418 RepID=A0A1D2VMM2_9ASCO|nr:Clavaminate synthase-like protein [Ascoidea rubescens DSM 1968]ODV62850.1 Clavaminate synthase-like protein [Ascoidea rubescens DSM 1968]
MTANKPTLKINFYNDKVTSITFIDNEDYSVPDIVNFSNVFLRDSSTSPDAFDPVSGQKLFTTSSIPKDLIPAKEPEIYFDNSLNEFVIKINWSDKNESVYPESFLRKYSSDENRKSGKYYEDRVEFWNLKKLLKPHRVLYYDYISYLENKDKAFLNSLINLNKFGLTFINNIPKDIEIGDTEDPYIEKIAKKIGYIKETFWGRLFDVRSVPTPKNIAYSSKEIILHMDLMYYESPPGLQLLHSINNKVEGGESIFVDAFNAARYVMEKDPHGYFALCNVPINYHYDNDGHHYFYSRPLIVEDQNKIDPLTNLAEITEINYSPPFQAPFEFGITSPLRKIGDFKDHGKIDNYQSAKDSGDRYLFRDFHRGLKIFEDFINNPENQYQLRLEAGEAVIFDNRRILHARTEFVDEVGSKRWLKGCYIDRDSYFSKLRTTYKAHNI